MSTSSQPLYQQFDIELRFAIRKNRLARVRAWFQRGHMQPSPGREDCINSPLVYAVVWRRPDIVSYLVHEQSMRIPLPHPATCGCSLCCRVRSDPRFAHMYARRVLMALVSPIYICSLDCDPLDYYLDCFRRIRELRQTVMRHNRSHFRELRKSVENSISSLIDCCETYEDVHAMLVDGMDESLVQGIENFEPRLGRAQLFLELRLHNPAVHRATQTLVNRVWVSDLPWLARIRSPLLQSVALYATSIVCFGVVAPIVVVFPHPALVGLVKSRPVASCFELISTYANVATVLWTVLVGMTSTSLLCTSWTADSVGYMYSAYSLMLAFILGRICREAHDIYCLGLHMNHINMFDRCLSVSNAFQLAGVVTLLIGITRVGRNHLTDPVALKAVQLLCPNDSLPTGQEICNLSDHLNSSEVQYLAEWSVPERIGSSLLSIGHLLLFLSLGNAFEMHKITGVLTFTVQKMFKDIGQFFVFMTLVLLGFSSALTTMYQNFRCGVNNFSNFSDTTNILYWGIYAMSDTAAYNLTDQIQARDGVTLFAVNFGLFLYGSYILISSVVGVNLLIALMSVTFEDIQANKNDKWLFGKTRRQLKLILLKPYHRFLLPVPLNLLSMLPYGILALCWLIRRLFRRCRSSVGAPNSDISTLEPERQQQAAAELEFITSYVARRTVIEKCLVKQRIKYRLCEFSKSALRASQREESAAAAAAEDREEMTMEMAEEDEGDEDDEEEADGNDY